MGVIVGTSVLEGITVSVGGDVLVANSVGTGVCVIVAVGAGVIVDAIATCTVGAGIETTTGSDDDAILQAAVIMMKISSNRRVSICQIHPLRT